MAPQTDWPAWKRGLNATVQRAAAAVVAARAQPQAWFQLLSHIIAGSVQHMPHQQAQKGEKAKLAAAHAAQAFLALQQLGLIGTRQPVAYWPPPDLLAAFQPLLGMLQVDSQELFWLNQQLAKATTYHGYKRMQLPAVEVANLFTGVVRLPPLVMLPNGALQPHPAIGKPTSTSRCVMVHHPADGPDVWRAMLMAVPLRFFQTLFSLPQLPAAPSNAATAGQQPVPLPQPLRRIIGSATATQQSAVAELLRLTRGNPASMRAIPEPVQRAAELHAHSMYQDFLDLLLTVSLSLPGMPSVPASPPNTRTLSNLMRAEVEAQPAFSST